MINNIQKTFTKMDCKRVLQCKSMFAEILNEVTLNIILTEKVIRMIQQKPVHWLTVYHYHN